MSVPLPTREEFGRRLNLWRQQVERATFRILILWFTVWACFLVAAPFIDKRSRNWLTATALALLLFLAIHWFYVNRRIARWGRESGVVCGACGEALGLGVNSKLALTTGRCPICGSAVISDP